LGEVEFGAESCFGFGGGLGAGAGDGLLEVDGGFFGGLVPGVAYGGCDLVLAGELAGGFSRIFFVLLDGMEGVRDVGDKLYLFRRLQDFGGWGWGGGLLAGGGVSDGSDLFGDG